MANCPKCDKQVQPDWAACPWCGATIPRGVTCSRCGKSIESSWNACPYCGYSVDGQKQGLSIEGSVVKGDIRLSDERDQSTHNTTVMDNSTTNVGQQFVGSTVTINQAPTRSEQAAAALEASCAALAQGAPSVAAIRTARVLDPRSPDANLALGIAVLSCNKIGRLSHAQAQEAEDALQFALKQPRTAAAAAHALAALRHCFYQDHSMRQPQPTFDDLRNISRESGRPEQQHQEWLRHIQCCESFMIDLEF